MYGSSKIRQSNPALFRQAEDNSTHITFMPERLEMIDEVYHEIIVLPFNANQEPSFITKLGEENGRPIFNTRWADPHIQITMIDVNADAIVNFVPLNSSPLDGIVVHGKTGDVCSATVVKWITAACALNSNKKFKECNKQAYKLLSRTKERQFNDAHPFAI